MRVSKVEFLKSDLFMNSWSAAVQHNKVYADGVKEREKYDLLIDIEEYVNKLSKQYKHFVSEDDHIDNIENIKNYIEEKYSRILYENIIRVGTVQKFFNLLLKYYWSCSFISEPPHCPVDRIVLQTIKINNINWTEIESINDYKSVIKQIKERIGGKTLSQWELNAWKRRRLTTASTL